MTDITIIQGDSIQEMQKLPNQSINMILCDLPYGMTANKWDSIIPLDSLWIEFKRLLKPKGCVVLTGMQPFTSKLVMSNPEWFKYEWIWKKDAGTGFLNAKKQPLRNHENILVFSEGQGNYNPQMMHGKKYNKLNKGKRCESENYGRQSYILTDMKDWKGERFPKTVIFFNRQGDGRIHPTQKPVNLFMYLIETYTDEGDTVLDCCIGSGTTAIACMRTDRKCIGIEKEQKYVDMTNKRIKDEC